MPRCSPDTLLTQQFCDGICYQMFHEQWRLHKTTGPVLTVAAALLQAATSSADAPSSSSRVLSVSLYASRCAVAFFLCASRWCGAGQMPRATFMHSMQLYYWCKPHKQTAAFDCLLHCFTGYLAGSEHVSRLHVQRPSLLRRQLQFCWPGVHASADHWYQVMRKPRGNAVPAGAVSIVPGMSFCTLDSQGHKRLWSMQQPS